MDLISRQKAIDAVISLCDDCNTCYCGSCRINDPVDKDAKKVLEELPSAQPEPCDDAVSREAAIDAALSAFSRGLLASPDIRKLPSVQPEPQWIPCSERLPGENEFVLVTFGWFGRKTDPGVNIDVIRDGDWMISEVVTAWMPLPEPYRAERRTDGVDS